MAHLRNGKQKCFPFFILRLSLPMPKANEQHFFRFVAQFYFTPADTKAIAPKLLCFNTTHAPFAALLMVWLLNYIINREHF